MGFFGYIWLVIKKAAENSVLLTDKLTVLVVPFSTLVLWMAGARMTSSVQETLALGVAITVVVVVLLRLALASYWLWRDDQAEKKEFQAKLDSPQFAAEASMRSYAVELRKELSACLGRLVALTQAAGAIKPFDDVSEVKEVIELDRKINQLSSQLSYDVASRVSALQLKTYCLNLIQRRLGKEQTEDDERLWEQRKLTFRIIHGDHKINEIMTLLELDILLEDNGVVINKAAKEREDSSLEQLKVMMRQLGSALHEPDLIEYLRRETEGGSANSLKALQKKYGSKFAAS